MVVMNVIVLTKIKHLPIRNRKIPLPAIPSSSHPKLGRKNSVYSDISSQTTVRLIKGQM